MARLSENSMREAELKVTTKMVNENEQQNLHTSILPKRWAFQRPQRVHFTLAFKRC
jgi:hypothetical protein